MDQRRPKPNSFPTTSSTPPSASAGPDPWTRGIEQGFTIHPPFLGLLMCPINNKRRRELLAHHGYNNEIESSAPKILTMHIHSASGLPCFVAGFSYCGHRLCYSSSTEGWQADGSKTEESCPSTPSTTSISDSQRQIMSFLDDEY